MKKLLGIVVLGLLWCNVSSAESHEYFYVYKNYQTNVEYAERSLGSGAQAKAYNACVAESNSLYYCLLYQVDKKIVWEKSVKSFEESCIKGRTKDCLALKAVNKKETTQTKEADRYMVSTIYQLVIAFILIFLFVYLIKRLISNIESKKSELVKKNWFKVQFEKHPYLYTFVIGWPILFYIIDFIAIRIGARFHDVLFIIFLSFPIIIFFLWFRKNKSKIKPFYKRNTNEIKQKTRKPLFSIFQLKQKSLLVPALFIIIGILSFDKFSNFSFNNSKDEYKNVNFNSLSQEEKRAYTCVMTYGFKKGSSNFKNCVFKIAQAELELQRLDEQRRIADAQLKAAREANEQARLQTLRQQQLALEQQRAESLDRSNEMLLNLGLGLLRGNQPQSRTNCRWFGNQWTCSTW